MVRKGWRKKKVGKGLGWKGHVMGEKERLG